MKTTRWVFGRLERFALLWVIIVSLFFSLSPAAAEEDRKSLEELLVEKGVISQDDAAAIQGKKFSKWVDRLSFAGDLRLRHESILKDPDRDRHRERFRLRVGSELKVGDFIVGIRLASSTASASNVGYGDQVSTNQSFDNLFTPKPIWIDRVFVQWRGTPWVTLTVGKMANPFYIIPDVVWDDDTNPEGFAQNFQLKLSDSLVLFANAGQFVLDEDATDNNDQWLFGEQVGVQLGSSKSFQVVLAGAFYNFKNATRGTFGQTTVQEGNTRVSATDVTLVNAYRVLDVTAEITARVGAVPISLIGDYVKNLADTTTDEDTGYQVGGRIGKANDPQTWEIGYFYRLMEADATLSDLADSDFGDGGTNRKGHIIWAAYQFNKAMQLKTRYLMTKVKDETLPLLPGATPGKDDVDRIQVDFMIRF